MEGGGQQTNSYLNHESKYNGLLEPSWTKVIRDLFFAFLSYMDSIVSRFETMHNVISIWRLIQLWGASTCASYIISNNSPHQSTADIRYLYQNGIPKNVIGIISILFHLIPSFVRMKCSNICNLVLFSIFFIFYIIWTGSTIYYRKTAKLPDQLVYFINIILSTLFLVLPPIMINLSGEALSRAIYGNDNNQNEDFGLAGTIIVIILTIGICFLTFICFQLICVSLIFRPLSLQTILPQPQSLLNMYSYFITLFLAVGSQLSKIPKIVMMVISLLLYILAGRIPFMSGTIINMKFRKAYLAVIISSVINLIMLIVCIILDFQMNQLMIFVLPAIFVVCYFISHFIMTQYISRQLATLDILIDDQSAVDLITSPDKMAGLICTSMQYAHQTTQDWNLFNIATEKWSDSKTLWLLYAKFVAIYPEESNLLGFIVKNMVSHDMKGFTVKQMIAQTTTIQMQRECTLTSQLKKKLTLLAKSVTNAKTRLRHIWDLVIQGNIADMESAVDAGKKSVDRCKNDFLHTISQYPNNRFVARSYSRFLIEVLGDHDLCVQWTNKAKQLKNGVISSQDLPHILGCAAFPMIPDQTKTSSGLTASITMTDSEMILGLDVDIADNEGNQFAVEQTKMIANKIKSISIPSINWSIIITILLFIIFCVCIPAVLFTYSNYFIDDVQSPLNFLYNMALVHNYNFMIPLFLHHYVMENIPQTMTPGANMVFAQPNFDNCNLNAFNNFDRTRDQLMFLCQKCSQAIEQISQFHDYKPHDSDLEKARTVLYDPIIVHHYYSSATSYTNMTMALQSIIVDNVVLVSDLLKESEPNSLFFVRAFTTPNALNPFYAAYPLDYNISSILENTVNYFVHLSEDVKNRFLLIMIIICVVGGVLCIVCLVLFVYFIGKDRDTIYKCLTALPKNVVSSVSESLRILKKDGESKEETELEDTDVSKQEDSILKLFATAGDSNSSLSVETVMFIFFYIVLTVLIVLSIYLVFDLLPQIASALETNVPHIVNTLSSASYIMGTEISLNDAVVGTFGYGPFAPKFICIGERTSREQFLNAESYIKKFFDSYHKAKFGSDDQLIKPYDKFNEKIESVNYSIQCQDQELTLTLVHTALDCMPFDLQILMVYNLMEKVTIPWLTRDDQNQPFSYNPQFELFTEIWYLAIKLYCEVFEPMFNDIIPSMNEKMNSVEGSILPILICIILVCFILCICIIFTVLSIRSKLIFTMNLLLHCDPLVVCSTSKIMDVLSGDFSNKNKDVTSRDKIYYDSILKEMPNAIVILDNNYKLIESNAVFDRLFEKYSLKQGDDIRQFYKSIFTSSEFEIANGNECTLELQTETTIYLKTTVLAVNTNYAISMSDITRIVSYNNLIKEERNKSDQLLSSILPSNLVARVQAGEKNISFSVPSASILFMDIVEFTPWCASGTAQYIMSTLNLLYKYFDDSLAQRKTLTKIKCIGDCYMAAGGIFSELNQPAVHARETVEFGLSSIDDVRRINQEKNEKLQIRVGINTGGPLVAGVLGTEKPTFEILGPPINIAQQMEHNGVPMQVHISRSVYELIYGGSIKIKERGQIEIKQGKVITYLIDGS